MPAARHERIPQEVHGWMGRPRSTADLSTPSSPAAEGRRHESDSLHVIVTGGTAVELTGRVRGLGWASAARTAQQGRSAADLAIHDDVASATCRDDGAAELRVGVSGAQPLYVRREGEEAWFANRLAALTTLGYREASAVDPGSLAPDWNAWSEILAIGAPLCGRTPFQQIRRFQPWERLSWAPDTGIRYQTGSWPWLELDGTGRGSIAELLDALDAKLSGLASSAPLGITLSGGWDSRLLAALASRVMEPTPCRAWTSSSDTGTTLEELVASQVANTLELDHHIVPAPHHRFATDLAQYGNLVDHQTSFHVWAVPLADALRGSGATILDGLGGGIFLNNAFDTATDDTDARFARLARYLTAADQILRPEVVQQLQERSRQGYEEATAGLQGHPHERALTAYLTRTWAGIAHGPYSLFAASTSVATPFTDSAVIRAASALEPSQRESGRLYRSLLERISPELARLPTAAELTGRQRQIPRRGASAAAAERYRELLTSGPVRDLLTPSLANADLPAWGELLRRTRSQHLIRSLAMLALWLDTNHAALAAVGVDELLTPVG